MEETPIDAPVHSRRRLVYLRFGFIISIVLVFSSSLNLKSSIQLPTIKPLRTQFSSSSIQCVIYVRSRDGRLGNRMFLVASAYGLARLHLCHLYLSAEVINDLKQLFLLHFSPPLLSSTQFDSFIKQNRSQSNLLSKDVGCEFLKELTRPNAIPRNSIFELTGYWQSYLHFLNYRSELRQEIFVSQQTVLQKASKFFSKTLEDVYKVQISLSADNHELLKQKLSDFNRTTWIGIHVRLKDFSKLNFASSDQYLLASMKYFTEKYPDAFFIVASDEKSTMKRRLQRVPNIRFTPDSFSPGEDLITLSLCEHSIVTGGTFSWWAAFLANGHVLHDRIYPSGCEKREHYYPPWFLIDGNVRAQKTSDFVLR